jgi:hypothetical protein
MHPASRSPLEELMYTLVSVLFTSTISVRSTEYEVCICAFAGELELTSGTVLSIVLVALSQVPKLHGVCMWSVCGVAWWTVDIWWSSQQPLFGVAEVDASESVRYGVTEYGSTC